MSVLESNNSPVRVLKTVCSIWEPLKIIRTLVVFVVGISCGSAHKSHYGAIIDAGSEWKITRDCGYERCYPLVDFVTHYDITIRIELVWGNRENKPLLLQVQFEPRTSNNFSFDPSRVTVTGLGGEELRGKGLVCERTLTDTPNLRSAPGLYKALPVVENDCFYLFFDRPSPRVDESITVNLVGLTKNGAPVVAPKITFRSQTRHEQR